MNGSHVGKKVDVMSTHEVCSMADVIVVRVTEIGITVGNATDPMLPEGVSERFYPWAHVVFIDVVEVQP